MIGGVWLAARSGPPETDAVVRLSQAGIEALRRLDGANDFYHLPMQLLAQGFERLLKLTIALAELKT